MKSYLSQFLAREGSPRLGLLANQTAYSLAEQAYSFQIMASRARFLRVFLPEHGLFAELQDQVGLEETRAYEAYLRVEERKRTEFLSLYGFQENSLRPDPQKLSDLDWLVVDLQDVGSRYYTFLTTLYYCLQVIHELRQQGAGIRCLVLDRPNPIGRLVEGTVLEADYESFVGLPGVIHRHGLSTGEMARLFASWLNLDADALEIGIEEHNSRATSAASATSAGPESMLKSGSASESLDDHPETSSANFRNIPGTSRDLYSGFSIYPSPNMPTVDTALVYPGQCLLEGTNLSEGRGSTRPFEIFGAPFLGPLMENANLFLPGAVLRPLRFLPTFHKHGGEICEGFQIHVLSDEYAPLFCSLRILRWIRSRIPEFEWKTGVYEFRSDRPAIELLAGDPLLLDYLRSSAEPAMDQLDEPDLAILEYMSVAESRWMEHTAFLWGGDSCLHSSSARLLRKYA
ncbi:MAG TPA: DUF1343 domain-containing protein [Leptospiraceae bacterium]|nr:hypothetical protein [Spirochaetaceae bacterium]HBS05122.1 DUF1343 domain-containing protein [Leptospiraceae bacterium]|tara:strand:+ start:2776 stop:4149 length:1374 start_codon:yes stop_codon:yes gene_type:complete